VFDDVTHKIAIGSGKPQMYLLNLCEPSFPKVGFRLIY